MLFRSDPTSWFSGFPKILGGIDLSFILDLFESGEPSDFPDFDPDIHVPNIPGLTTEVIYKDVTVLGQTQKVPIGMRIRYRWSTDKIKNSPGDVFLASSKDDKKTKLALDVSVAVEYSAADLLAVPDASKITASIESRADLTDFRVALFGTGSLGFVVLHFESLSFTAKTGQDPAVKPNLKEVEFLGAMRSEEHTSELQSH